MDVVCEEEQLFSVLAEEITAPISIDLLYYTAAWLARSLDISVDSGVSSHCSVINFIRLRVI